MPSPVASPEVMLTRELIRAAIQQQPNLACPWSGKVLDERRTVVAEVKRGPKVIHRIAVSVEAWQEKEAELRESLKRFPGVTLAVLDGREAWPPRRGRYKNCQA